MTLWFYNITQSHNIIKIRTTSKSSTNNQSSINQPTAIKESIKLGIPIVAILDSNSNPEGIDFPIPGNDDARRSIDLYCNLLLETINNAKKELPKQTEVESKKIDINEIKKESSKETASEKNQKIK